MPLILFLIYRRLAVRLPSRFENKMEILRALQPYTTRIFLCSSRQHIGDLTQLLRQIYAAPTLSIEKVTMTAGDREDTFERLALPNLPPIYLILLENPKVGPRRVKTVFDLVAYGKGAPAIIYVHDSAISNFKLAVLHNFPIVLFHNDAHFRAYFASNRLGYDDKELLFVLAQKQEYVMNQIVFREDFAHMKEERSTKRDKTRHQKTKTEERFEPLESPPQMKDVIMFSPDYKARNAFVDVARKSLESPPPSDSKNHRVLYYTTLNKPTSPFSSKTSQNSIKKPWTLPSDVQSSIVAAQPLSLFDDKQETFLVTPGMYQTFTK